MATMQNRNAFSIKKNAKNTPNEAGPSVQSKRKRSVCEMVRGSVVLREVVEWHARKVVRRDAGLALGDLLWTIFFGPVVLLFKSSQRSSQSIVKSRTLS